MQHHHHTVGAISRSKHLPRNIIIADDNELFAAGTAELLRGEGCIARTVTRGGDVIPAIEDEEPDALILDIGLPDMLGTDVSAAVARQWPDIPVVLVSGHFGQGELGSVLANPRVRFLTKPFAFEDLLHALQGAFGAADGGRDSR